MNIIPAPTVELVVMAGHPRMQSLLYFETQGEVFLLANHEKTFLSQIRKACLTKCFPRSRQIFPCPFRSSATVSVQITKVLLGMKNDNHAFLERLQMTEGNERLGEGAQFKEDTATPVALNHRCH